MINEITAGRFGQAVLKLFGIAGQGNPAPQVSPEYQPVVVLGNDRPEFRFLMSERRWSIFFDIGPDAAHNSGIQIQNPAASAQNPGLIQVVDIIAFDALNSAAAVVGLVQYIGNLALGAAALSPGPLNKDTRWTGIPQVSCTGATNVTAPPAANKCGGALCPVGYSEHPRWDPVVLKPGDSVAWISGNNCELSGVISGYERPLNQFETALG